MFEELDLQRDIARGVNEGMRSAEQEGFLRRPPLH
jgi:hypothetical protein